MAKKINVMKLVTVSIVLLFLVSGFSVMVYGYNSQDHTGFVNSSDKTIKSFGSNSGNVTNFSGYILNHSNNGNQNDSIMDSKSKYNPLGQSNLTPFIANYGSLGKSSTPGLFGYYSEPAPVGIADYGLSGTMGPSYSYNTPMFEGKIQISSLQTYSGVTKAYMSIQLNVVLVFSNNGEQYVYWIQDVAVINTSNNNLSFDDNIWNLSSLGSKMYNSTVIGNGSVFESFYGVTANDLPGAYIQMSYPSSFELRVISSITNEGQPTVAFQYNDGYGWVTYDKPVFYFVKDLTSDQGFVVNGLVQTPDLHCYDAELVMGGGWSGAKANDNESNVNLQLEYWNGHNFQSISNAFNFGSNTAETIDNALATGEYYKNNGTLLSNVVNGVGSLGVNDLGMLYNQNQVGFLNVKTDLIYGELCINGYSHTFVDNWINLTLAPGVYNISLINSGGTGLDLWNTQVILSAGQTVNLKAPNTYTVTFIKSGSSYGTPWSLNFQGEKITTNNSSISIYVTNGTYYYYIYNVTGYSIYPQSGTIFVNGIPQSIVVTFTLEYSVIFYENVLPQGTLWSVTLNGTIESTTGSSIQFYVTGGYYSYYIGPVMGYIPTISVNAGYVDQNVTVEVYFISSDSRTVSAGTYPVFDLYDPANGYIYVTNYESSNISVYHGGSLIFTIPLQSDPAYMLYDQFNENIYVTMVGGGLDIINSFTNSITNIIPNYYFSSFVFDTQNSYIYACGYHNVTVISTLNNEIVEIIPLNFNSDGITYDENNGYLYLINMKYNTLGGNVTILNPQTSSIIAIIPLQYSPSYVSYDADNGQVYVTGYYYNNSEYALNDYSFPGVLIAIDGFSIIKTINVGYDPIFVDFDLNNDYIFVVNAVSDNITVINGLSNTIYYEINSGNAPDNVAFDPNTGILFVTNAYSDDVSLIQFYNIDFQESGLPSGTPWYVTMEYNSTDAFYVYNQSSIGNEISFLIPSGACFYIIGYVNNYVPTVGFNVGNVTSNMTKEITFVKQINQSIKVGSQPGYSLYDPSNGLIYVCNEYNNSISVINGTEVTNVIKTTSFPESLVFDPANKMIYVLLGSGGIDVLNTVGNFSTLILPNYYFNSLTYDSSNGYLCASGNQNITSINPMTDQIVQELSLSFYPGEIVFNSANGYLYSLSFGNVSVINPSNGALISVINLNYYPTYMIYNQFNGYVYVSGSNLNYNQAIGLNGLSLNGYVTVIQGSSIVKQINVGYYPTFMSYDAGTGNVFVSNMVSDTISLIVGFNNTIIRNIPVYVPFISTYDPLSGNLYVTSFLANRTIFLVSVVKYYSINFTESGLPAGTLWYLNFTNGPSYSSVTNTINFKEANGSYVYTIATTNKEYSAQGGSLIVNGANLEISIKFNLVTYPITFTESGLSSGTPWSVTLNNIEKSSTNGTIIFNEPNGSYSYDIIGMPGYRANTYSGTINVNGNLATNNITWTIITYPITITESGISNGTSWSATLTGTAFNGKYINITLTSTTNVMIFNEPNGSYSYKVHLPSGYSGTNLSGSFTATGQLITTKITANPPSNYMLVIIMALIVVVAVLATILVMMRRGNKK
jgi:YVTN family beta-propeller protein